MAHEPTKQEILENDDMLGELEEARRVDNVNALRACKADPIKWARLHELEQLIANDIMDDSRRLWCASCAKWISALIAKAEGNRQ